VAVALVQANKVGVTSNTNPVNLSFLSSTTTGNLLIAVVHTNVNTVTSVTDNKGNTWTLFRSLVNYVGSWSQYIYYCANAVGGATHTVSVNENATGWNNFTAIHEFSGAAITSPIESATATVSTTSNAVASLPTNGAPITTVAMNDYVMGIFDARTSTTYTAATGWALLTTVRAGNDFATVGAAQVLNTSYTPHILSAITGWSELAWSLAIKQAGAVAGSSTGLFFTLF
jgi:hypothetical protein